MSRVFQQYGYATHDADDAADRVMNLETQIAEVHRVKLLVCSQYAFLLIKA